MHKRTLRGTLGATALVTGLLAGLPAMASAQVAAPHAVTPVACTGGVGNVGDLISKITSAVSGDTLVLGANCTYTLASANNSTDGRNGLPVIVQTLTLVGHNTTITRSSAGSTPLFRIFEVANSPAASLTLRGITVSNGKDSSSSGIGADGGCILARFSGTPTPTTPTTLVLHDSSVEGCTTGTFGSGGGIYLDSDAHLQIFGSRLADNTARGVALLIDGGGGGIYVNRDATASVAASVLTGNSATLGLGGGIHVDGSADLTDTQLAGNSALVGGGGIYIHTGAIVHLRSGLLTDDAAALGGGVFVGSSGRSAPGGILRVTASSLHNNEALNGGGVYVDDGGIAVIDTSFLNHNSAGLLTSSAPSSAAINAKAPKAGAAPAAILPGHGGFLYNDGNSRLTQDTLIGNHALLTGGAIYTNGRLLIGASTVQTNRALISGGAVYADSAASSHFAAVQFQLNIALISGGAIFNDGHAFLQSSFVEGNIAPLGGGIYEARPFGMAVFNSLIFGNTLNNCRPVNSVPLCAN